jgi:hypothetical protein
MDTWMTKVNSCNLSLIIKLLEVAYEFLDELMGLEYLFPRDSALVENPEACNELAEVLKVPIREDVVESTRSKDKHVYQELPCLVST